MIHIDHGVEKFIQSLEKETIARVLRSVDLLEAFGPKLGLPHSRRVAVNLYELRVRGRQEIRIFYAFLKLDTFLLHGFVKKSQKMPRKELAVALRKQQALTSS